LSSASTWKRPHERSLSSSSGKSGSSSVKHSPKSICACSPRATSERSWRDTPFARQRFRAAPTPAYGHQDISRIPRYDARSNQCCALPAHCAKPGAKIESAEAAGYPPRSEIVPSSQHPERRALQIERSTDRYPLVYPLSLPRCITRCVSREKRRRRFASAARNCWVAPR